MSAWARKLRDGQWFFEWNCAECMDSGIRVTMFVDVCSSCTARLNPVSHGLMEKLRSRTIREVKIDSVMLNMARALIPTSAAEPVQGEALAMLLEIKDREVKNIAARLCDEWSFPAVATRKPPYGYFVAGSAAELLEWGRVTRSQAIRMLARFYHLYRSNFPALAGQQPLSFVDQVSSELQEAIR